MNDSIDTGLTAFFKERLTNPVISSIAISWSLYNYKFYVILFSDNSVIQRSALIKERFPDIEAILIHGVFWPALFAALYLFGSPYVTAWYYGWLRDRQKKVDEVTCPLLPYQSKVGSPGLKVNRWGGGLMGIELHRQRAGDAAQRNEPVAFAPGCCVA